MDPAIMNGDYADPFHPYCERHISVNPDSQSFHYWGTAVGPKDDTVLRGCSKEEQVQYGSRKGEFDGLIIRNGEVISAGDGIHEGVWESKSVVVQKGMTGGGIDGIRWNDGNKWTKLDSSSSSIAVNNNEHENEVGKFIVVVYFGISVLAGLKEMVVRIQNKFDS